MCREQYVLVSKQKRDLESSRNRQSGGADTTGQELTELQEKYATLVKQSKRCSTSSGRNQSETVGTDTSLDELKQEMADLQIRHDRLEGDNKKLQDNVVSILCVYFLGVCRTFGSELGRISYLSANIRTRTYNASEYSIV